MTKLLKAELHKRPTYSSLVRDTILDPKDKIALPDREATILRKTQQLTRYDEAEFLDLEKDNENIAKEKAQQERLKTTTGSNTDGSISETKATAPGTHQSHDFQSKPPAPPPGGGGGVLQGGNG